MLLQGVVGSGKTSLVEHLAKLTGRSGPPHLVKIQLGDQMDSKVYINLFITGFVMTWFKDGSQKCIDYIEK